MGKSPKANLDRITTTITAWETHRANKTFVSMTLEQFMAAINPSITTRTEVSKCESALKAAISLREKPDETKPST